GRNPDDSIWLGSNQVNGRATVNVQGSDPFSLTNQNEAITGTLTVISGLNSVASVTTGPGTLTIANNVTESAQANSFGNINSVTISGTVALQISGGAAATRTFTANDTIGDVDLMLVAKITDGDGNANLQNIT